ncbi:hypothetical protein QUF80_05725 [Desulfococcaceae bacterium HSG8]|nr:hypothetical protein [Desulfococcaceae bacterium HSG8]
MRKSLPTIVLAVVFIIASALPAFAQGHDHGKKAMDHSEHKGEMIHESSVDGYKFGYHLIDMKEKMKHMKNMPEMKATHHLMVYVESPDGHEVEKAKVGYLVEGPGDSKQKLMAMGMAGGFGADVDFSAKGAYVVKTKMVAGDKKLADKFEYEVK